MYNQLPFWQYLVYALILGHVSAVSVSVYLHRCETHGSLVLHPFAANVFRLAAWLLTGTTTREWVAVHRYHHATTETTLDPHSPMHFGIHRILFGMYFRYRKAKSDALVLSKYGYGAPDDWMERHVYKHSWLGLVVMLGIDLALFGLPGLGVWAFQMLWMPGLAGIINGAGHYWGYRNYDTMDNSRNLLPIGFLIAGEELHNNHHGKQWCAKFSRKWFEFDVSWFYICMLEKFGLAARIRGD